MARIVARLTVAASVVAVAACGFTGNFRMNPGFANLGSPGVWDTDREFRLSVGPLPLKLARVFFADDPEIAGILGDLKGVRVYTYEVDGDAQRVHERIEATHRRLVEEDWLPVVVVREDGGLVTALVRLDEPDRIRGLVVMVQDDEDVVLVNLIGAIRPETFALAMDEMGIELPTVALTVPRDCARTARTLHPPDGAVGGASGAGARADVPDPELAAAFSSNGGNPDRVRATAPRAARRC